MQALRGICRKAVRAVSLAIRGASDVCSECQASAYQSVRWPKALHNRRCVMYAVYVIVCCEMSLSREYMQATSRHASSRQSVGDRITSTVAFVAGIPGVCRIALSRLLPHFRSVSPGILYRSGQPKGLGLHVVRHRGIRTLVNVRKPGRPGIDAEALFAESHGLRFFHLPWGSSNDEIQRTVTDFLDIVRNSENWPVLVHCSRGKERSGVMAAAFRIAENGWSRQRALDELFAHGLEPGTMPSAEAVLGTLTGPSAPVREASGQGSSEPAPV